MKEFIYLDTSFLHSFIAQIFGGLPTNITNETQESRTETKSETAHQEKIAELQSNLNAMIAKVGSKVTPRKGSSQQFSLAQLDVGKEIISKQLHDNSINDLIDYLRKENLLTERVEEAQLSKYILIKSNYNIVDINQLKILTKKEFHSILGFTNKNGKNQNSRFNPSDLTKIFDFLTHILPSEIFIKQGKFLSPLKIDFIREQSKELIFKHSQESEVSLLGKVTRKFKDEIDGSDDVGSIFEINNIISSASSKFLTEFGVLYDDDYIVTPIAIFFESI